MDVAALASAGATAIMSAMATDAWPWVRTELSKLFGRQDAAREEAESARLDGFSTDLSTTAERDVHNRLLGYAEARLADEVAARGEFLTLITRICTELGLEPPDNLVQQHVVAHHSAVVQIANGQSQVVIGAPATTAIRWIAMKGVEAARRLEQLELEDAVAALADMESGLAARRFSLVEPATAKELLVHMDEGLAVELLARLAEPGHAAGFLAQIDPTHSAAILDLATADWAVARLAEMDPDRALVLLGAMGSKRTDDLLCAMESQQAVRLLGAVSKVLSDQARVRKTFDLAQTEAEQIATDARRRAEETVEQARIEAAQIRAAAQPEPTTAVPPPDEQPRDAAGPGQAAQYHEPGRSAWLPDGYPAPDGRHDPSTAAELFLLCHDVDGRARIKHTILETGIAGAVLCDLVRVGAIDVVGSAITPGSPLDSSASVARVALQRVAQLPDQSTMSWLSANRKEIYLLVTQQLIDAGTITAIARSTALFGSGVRYKPAVDARTLVATAHLVRGLVDLADTVDEPTATLARLVYLLQLEEALPLKLKPRQVRVLLREFLGRSAVPTTTHAALNGVDDAIAAVVMSGRA